MPTRDQDFSKYDLSKMIYYFLFPNIFALFLLFILNRDEINVCEERGMGTKENEMRELKGLLIINSDKNLEVMQLQVRNLVQIKKIMTRFLERGIIKYENLQFAYYLIRDIS